MKKAGRNDPCPCGSGKKYKNCCLNKDLGVNSKDSLWRKLRTTHDQLATKLIKYALHRYGPDFIEYAWEDYALESGRKYDPNSQEIQLFIPWVLYSWVPFIDDKIDNYSDELDYDLLAASYLKTHYHQLSAMERRFIEITTDAPFSFFEIVECDPGYGFRLKDLLQEKEIYVIEKSGSQNASPGMVIFGQVIQYEEVGMLIATGPIFMPPGYKLDIMQLRKRMQKQAIGQTLDRDDLVSWEDELRLLYFSLHDRMYTPPKLVNTDGDPLLFHDIYYEIESPQAAFDKLKTLAIDVEEQELLTEAVFDNNGNLQEIEFPWLKKGNPRIKSWKNTVMGHILISQKQLKITVNSEKRARTIKNRIKKLLKNEAVYKRTEVHTVESLMEQAGKEPAPGMGSAMGLI